MKPVARIAASAFMFCAYCSAAAAMSTVPNNGQYPGVRIAPGANSLVRDPNNPDNVTNPYASRGFYTFGGNTGDGVTQRGPDRTGGFINNDPFDPNSVMNNYDRYRYANPYPFDPVYNPYGQGSSPSAPLAPYIIPGQGVPYGR